MKLSVLYRGPLSSCNYGCAYCPFSKRRDSSTQLGRDREALGRFLAWVAGQSMHELSLLFTPWGEALVRRWYRDALVELTQLPHVRKAAIQTNLSAPLDWIEACRVSRLGLWTTWHPTETSLERFAAKVRRLHALGVGLSVGVVGVPEHAPHIERLRAAIPSRIYVWINAQVPRQRPYLPEEIERFTRVDPLFLNNLARQPSFGRPCLAGESSFTVDGRGDMRRCHFVGDVIGNIYDANWEQALVARDCPREYCPCHLGRVNLPGTKAHEVFGIAGVERAATLVGQRA